MTAALGAAAAVVAVLAAVRGLWSPCGLSMVSTLNPFSERSRGHRYWLTAAWFVAGAAAGGALLGAAAALGAAGWRWLGPTATVTLIVAAACCLIAFTSDTPIVRWRLPLLPRQVNEQWVGRYRRWIYAAGFGVQIGLGVATYVMTAGVYLTVALAVLTGSPGTALLIGILFGLVRGSAVLIGGRADDPIRLRTLHARLDRLEPWSLRVVVAAELLAGAAFGWLLAGAVGAVAVAVLAVLAAVVPLGRRRVGVRSRPGTLTPT